MNRRSAPEKDKNGDMLTNVSELLIQWTFYRGAQPERTVSS